MIRRVLGVVLGILTVIGWAPLLVAATATAIASSRGCRLTEAGPSPCLIGGQDYGNVLYQMSMMWWVAMLTFPLGLAALVAWIVALVRRRR